MFTVSEWNYVKSAQITWEVHQTWRCFLKTVRHQGIISATTSRDKYQLWRHHLLLQGGKGRYFFPYQGNWYLYVYLKQLNMAVIDFEEKIVTQCEEYQDQLAKCSTPLSKWILWQRIPASPIDHQPPSQATHCSGCSFPILIERNWFFRFRLENIFQQNPKFLVGMIFVISIWT